MQGAPGSAVASIESLKKLKEAFGKALGDAKEQGESEVKKAVEEVKALDAEVGDTEADVAACRDSLAAAEKALTGCLASRNERGQHRSCRGEQEAVADARSSLKSAESRLAKVRGARARAATAAKEHEDRNRAATAQREADYAKAVAELDRQQAILEQYLGLKLPVAHGPYTPLVPSASDQRMGLASHEAPPKYHTMEKHIDKSIEYLQGRIDNEKGRLRASAYFNIEIAERAISTAIDARATHIVEQLGKLNEHERFSIGFTMPEPVGVVLCRGSSQLQTGSKVIVRIEKRSDMLNGFQIITSFVEL